MKKTIFLISMIVFLTGCNSAEKEKENSLDLAVASGEEVFNKNCVSCHGSEGRGLAENWKVKDENGNFPAPPLNGTAHTWHHTPSAIISAMRALARAILSASFAPPPELRCSMVERLSMAMATRVISTIMLTVATRANPCA